MKWDTECEWDETKNAINIAKHKIGFAAIAGMQWDRMFFSDRTREYEGELRYAGVGLLNGKLHTVIFTWRGEKMRIISLRRSNNSEENAYENYTKKS